MYTDSFNTQLVRKNTGAIKYDRIKTDFGTENILPMWVADMDIPVPPFIMEAIQTRCQHPILGYTLIPERWYQSILNWLAQRYQWEVQKQEIGFLPGIVSGIALAIQCFSKPGDRILIQSPVYPPFRYLPKANGRELVENSLVYRNNQFEIDFEDFEEKAASGCRMFILCSPHNPGGRVWSKEALERMLAICAAHDICVVSDEIHADLTLPGHQHHPAAMVETSDCALITLMAPSKTFNIPGLNSSFYVIQNESVRTQFDRFLQNLSLNHGNLFAYEATVAAYEQGAVWLEELTRYLQTNIDYVDAFLKAHIPQITCSIPQASFLIWLDCRNLGMNQKELETFFIHEAGLGLNTGTSFGPEGYGFMRLNIGCPIETLQLAMSQLKSAIKQVKTDQ